MVCSLDDDKERLNLQEACSLCLELFKGCIISCLLHVLLIFLNGIIVYYMLKAHLRNIFMLDLKGLLLKENFMSSCLEWKSYSHIR